MSTSAPNAPIHFIKEIINEDARTRKHDGRVHTRFPPEPNGYLHIGHAKSICLNFGLALEYGGRCNLRFDDTNPSKEDVEYVDSIIDTVRWLGFDWDDRLFYASDYFEQLYQYAEHLIRTGHAYVCHLSADAVREHRGTLIAPGRESPYRGRPVEENLDLFRRMRAGEFPDGHCVLRAKIDMASGNINMRDPVLYRILRATHHRTGDAWCIYPMYDYAHPISDAIEGITHSICTLEFEDHRPFYDWVLDHLPVPSHPQQIEFARLNLTYTVMSKRKLLQLVEGGHVEGWDDPRMPTLAGMRRRGFTPEAVRDFCERIGVAKVKSTVDYAFLEHCQQKDSNRRSSRVMVVLRPLRVEIENYPEEQVEWFDAENIPKDSGAGTRKIPFSRVVYIEREDFMEDPPKEFHRLAPGREIRLVHAYIIKCVGVEKNDRGEITGLRCTYDTGSRGGEAPDGRKIKVTTHWVSAEHAIDVEVRLFEHLLKKATLDEEEDFLAAINPASFERLSGCKAEPGLASARPGARFQFLRQGYFCADFVDCREGRLVFNRTVTLKDEWARVSRRTGGSAEAV